MTDEESLADQMAESQAEDEKRQRDAEPADKGYTGEPCVQCGRNRVFRRRDGQRQCEKCEVIQPDPRDSRT